MESRDSGLGVGDSGKKRRGWGKAAGFWGLGVGGWGAAVLLTMLAASLPGFAKQSAESSPVENLTIVLHVYDYAQVEPSELARAQDEASRVLGRAGIEAVWLDCSVPGLEPQNAQECRSTVGALVLRILPRAMAERLARAKGSLGFAQLADSGAPDFVASVFYHRVESLAVDLACARAVILGYALAHEVGHLLLGTNSHSPNGIMRARWSEKEMLAASAGRFGFFPQQAVKIRADIRTRQALASPMGRAEELHRITVRVFNYAEVSSAVLAEAEGEATRIFERVGMAVAWIDCRPPAGSAPSPAACEELLGPTDLALRILSGSRAARATLGEDTLGYAVISGGRGSMASVFHDRARQLAEGGMVSHCQALGHAMAHEIGHLLLGTAQHASRGIMRARWEREDLHDAARRGLVFDPQQAERLRAEVHRRVAVAASAEAVGTVQATGP